MNVEVKRANADKSPMSTMPDYVVESVSRLMVSCGIKSIECQRYTSGIGGKNLVSITPFEDAPQPVIVQALVIKEALADILSVANIVGLGINPTDEEAESIRAMWRAMVEDAEKEDSPNSEGQARPEPDEPSEEAEHAIDG